MATLVQLIEKGVLRPVHIKLRRNEFRDRFFLGLPGFRTWLENEVKTATAFYEGDIQPKRQALAILKDFIVGKPFPGPKLYKKMSPHTDDVWELRTPDLRFFGWFYRKNCYIATSGELFEKLKADERLYEEHRINCIKARNGMDLDPPKYLQGATADDVID
ncbi:hypothetical protein HFO28_07795 [Rhizobium leguminosarum]|uniref:hypothetical protein n=1 Tax=Rhizobium leguminosarum TaxID=384 RepID=UPI001C93F9D0|nr:hypothetical protein [Rhizobium leguminosarum]MBY5743494.1 hypothetical protein [Rhizobium leguminosarum]